MKRLIFKAQLGDGPIQVVGSYDMSDEEWTEYVESDPEDIEDFLQNTASDWAYEAVHSDCLSYWTELE